MVQTRALEWKDGLKTEPEGFSQQLLDGPKNLISRLDRCFDSVASTTLRRLFYQVIEYLKVIAIMNVAGTKVIYSRVHMRSWVASHLNIERYWDELLSNLGYVDRDIATT